MSSVRAARLDLPLVLRTWRAEVTQLSQAVAAAGVGVSEGALSMWEHGRRRVGYAQLAALDGLYGADGALVDVALAIGTPGGLPARTAWAHNAQGPSAPHWAWVRPSPGANRVDARIMWGAFAFDCSGPCDERGLFVTSPVSMPNPAGWVHLRDPGWVDFGRGTIPPALGIPTFESVAVARLAGSGHSPAGLVAPDVVRRFTTDPAFADAVLDFFGVRRDLVRDVFSTANPAHPIVDLTRPPEVAPPAHRPFTGTEYRALRRARGLSQAEAAQLASALSPAHRVSDDQVAVLERGGRPRAARLRTRLDRVYRADGVCALERVDPIGDRPPFTFVFPGYWIGPVWFTFVSPDGRHPGYARLDWDRASKQLFVAPGTTVTCRRPVEDPVPFVVTCPAEWTVVGGMGARPDARDVNWAWFNPDDRSTRGDALVHELFLGLFGRTRTDFDDLMRRFSPPGLR
jgi:transcriptional regulator with XRE-family HTH domain